MQAPPSSAPVLVVAPHATLADSLAIAATGATAVAKEELSAVPLVGRIGRFLQVLFVKREKEESRRKVVDQIRRHAFSVVASKWPRPLLLYPEGTCTNGRALIHFKAGAFQSGLPVQPVAVRFPNRPDTLTWTWDQGYGAMACLWLTLCQLHTRAEVL